MNEGLQIVITLSPDGSVRVDGPIQNKVLSLGLLSIAEQVVKDFKPNQPRIAIVPANGLPNKNGGVI